MHPLLSSSQHSPTVLSLPPSLFVGLYQHSPIESSGMTELSFTRAAQYESHWPSATVEHLRLFKLASRALRPLGCWKTDWIGKNICVCVFSQNLRKSHLHFDKKICLCCSNNHFLAGGKAGHMSAERLAEETPRRWSPSIAPRKTPFLQPIGPEIKRTQATRASASKQ